MNLTTVKPEKESSKNGKTTSTPQKKGGATPSEKPFNLVEYFKGVKQEWHKITWLSRPQVIAETVVVLIVVTFFSIFVFIVDKIFQFMVKIIT